MIVLCAMDIVFLERASNSSAIETGNSNMTDQSVAVHTESRLTLWGAHFDSAMGGSWNMIGTHKITNLSLLATYPGVYLSKSARKAHKNTIQKHNSKRCQVRHQLAILESMVAHVQCFAGKTKCPKSTKVQLSHSCCNSIVLLM